MNLYCKDFVTSLKISVCYIKTIDIIISKFVGYLLQDVSLDKSFLPALEMIN